MGFFSGWIATAHVKLTLDINSSQILQNFGAELGLLGGGM